MDCWLLQYTGCKRFNTSALALPLLVKGFTSWSKSAADTTLLHLLGRLQPKANNFILLCLLVGLDECRWPQACCAISLV